MEEDLEDDEGLPPMQHQILAHRPHPNQIDYDWEPLVTVIPDSQPEDDWPEPLAVIPDSEDNESVRI